MLTYADGSLSQRDASLFSMLGVAREQEVTEV